MTRRVNAKPWFCFEIGSFAQGHVFLELEPLFIMANTNFPFSSTLEKLETQTLGRSVIENLGLGHIFVELEPFFKFSIWPTPIFPFPWMMKYFKWKMTNSNLLVCKDNFIRATEYQIVKNKLILRKAGKLKVKFGALQMIVNKPEKSNIKSDF